MKDTSVRYVGDPDFHDGYIREVVEHGSNLIVTVEGDSRKLYRIRFSNVHAIESNAPVGMLLYALVQKDVHENESGDVKNAAYQYEFLNNNDHSDDDDEREKRLKFLASGFELELLR